MHNHPTTSDASLQSEARIQQEIIVWFHNNHCLPFHKPRSLILHIPNQYQQKLTNIGVYPGAADILIIHNGSSYFFEVKTLQGKQSPAQIKFQAHATDAGANYFIVHSLDEFKDIWHSIKHHT